jgi:hypothetical protein
MRLMSNVRTLAIKCQYCASAVFGNRCESCGAPLRFDDFDPPRANPWRLQGRIEVTHLRSPQGKREYVDGL